MRISDWSSDVCSSDLRPNRCRRETAPGRPRCARYASQALHQPHRSKLGQPFGEDRLRIVRAIEIERRGEPRGKARGGAGIDAHRVQYFGRSEEHQSELQSLMRISYAVFCLQKKKG